MTGRVLVVDDERSVAELLEIALRNEGYEVETAYSARDALHKAARWTPDVALVDIRMEDMSGIELLSALREIGDVAVIMMTAYASVETAVEAMRRGAFDYITKPFELDEIKLVVARAFEYKYLKSENLALREELKKYKVSEEVIGKDPKFLKVLEKAKMVARTDSTVLLVGESGTGKELIAREIHKMSRRANNLFIPVNIAAIPDELIESELFGHKKGAFTGATSDKKGLFEAANGGTLLLDEISEASPRLQSKLLRAIETKEIIPLGSTKPIKVNVRIIAATNTDLREAVRNGKFREDLFYRLNVVTIKLPPLRERKGDIPLLVEYFLRKYSEKHGIPKKRFSTKAMQILMRYHWPGNIRELQNVVEQALILSQGMEIEPNDLPQELLDAVKHPTQVFDFTQKGFKTLEEIEKDYIDYVLKGVNWDKRTAASILGIDLSTLYRKITKYRLKPPQKGGS